MSRNVGTFNIAANFEGLLKGPINAGQLVINYSALTSPSTWNQSGNVWLYNGAIVSVADDVDPTNNAIYYLKDADNYTMTCSWVKTSSVIGSITGAINGLSVTDQQIKLGGLLTGDTCIYGTHALCFGSITPLTTFTTIASSNIDLCTNSNSASLLLNNNCTYLSGKNVNISTTGNTSSISLTGSTVNILGNTKLVTTPTIGAVSDGILVWNSTDKYIKYISSNTLLSDAITGATNGLTKTGQEVKIGGIFTENTTICGDLKIFTLGTPTSRLTAFSAETQNIYGNAEQNINLYAGAIASINGAGCAMLLYNNGTKALCLDSNNMTVTDSEDSKGLVYANNYSINSGTNPRWIPDVSWVTGKTSTSGIQTVSNGLTKLGTNAVLGGALTGNTSLTGNYTLNICSGAKLNTTCGYQISGITILSMPSNTNTSIYVGNNIGRTGSTGTYNVGIGVSVLNACLSSGSRNYAIGCQNMLCLTTGSDNIAIGACTLRRISSGINNIAIGCASLTYNQTGQCNISIGINAMAAATNPSFNIAIGTNALIGSCSLFNIAIGNDVMYSTTTGRYNVGVGPYSLNKTTIGCNNTSIGYYSGYNNITGCSNVFIGNCAGFTATTSSKFYLANNSICNLLYGDFIQNFITLPTVKICNTPATGSNSDSILVWNSTDKCVKQITGTAILNTAITGATNGLTKVGQTVILGGALTGNTCVYSINGGSCSSVNFNTSLSTITTCTQGGDIILNTAPLVNVGGKLCIIAQSGATYGGCYHANYTNRTLVDKEYVDNRMNIINVRNTCGVCPFYINSIDYFIGVSGYTVGNCACLYLLPTPAIGQKIIISDIQGQALDYPIYIDGNGNCINGNGIAMVNTEYGSVTFVYNGVFWSPVAFIN